MAERIISIEESIKAEQKKSPVNKLAKLGRMTNLVTIPLGIMSGMYGLVLLDLASDAAYSEVQKRNNERIENRVRGRARMNTGSRMALVEPPAKEIPTLVGSGMVRPSRAA